MNKATYGIRLNSNKLIEDFSCTVTVESAVWEDNECLDGMNLDIVLSAVITELGDKVRDQVSEVMLLDMEPTKEETNTTGGLKYEGVFVVGDLIRSYDFQPIAGRKELFVEGVVTGTVENLEGAKVYTILATRDAWDEGEQDRATGISRKGKEIYVPMEVSFSEYTGRVVKI